MTLIIGIRCEDGLVLGADGMATLGTSLGQRTVQQSVKKLVKIDNQIIIGTSGPVGLGQRFSATLRDLWEQNKLSGKQPHEAMTILQEAFWHHAEKEFKIAQVTVPMLGQPGLESAISSTIVALPLAKQACMIQFNHQCSPEQATGDLPFIAMGSGQPSADVFLAFLKRIFWSSHHPKVSDGILATVWSLEQAIRTNPGGLGKPIQVMTLERVGGEWRARELGESDFAEHRQAISDAENALAKYRDSLTSTQGRAAPPVPAN